MRFDIYGLGAIGSNLLVQLAKQYPDAQFYGFDFDKVEERNLRTQAYFLEHVGQLKAHAMKVILARYIRKPKYIADYQRVVVGDKIEAPNGVLGIDCFDNSESRRIIRKGAGNLLHVGFSPFYTAECIWNEAYDVPGDVDAARADICSMPDAVAFIHFTVNAALLNIADWVQTGQKKNFLITGKNRIKWL